MHEKVEQSVNSYTEFERNAHCTKNYTDFAVVPRVLKARVASDLLRIYDEDRNMVIESVRNLVEDPSKGIVVPRQWYSTTKVYGIQQDFCYQSVIDKDGKKACDFRTECKVPVDTRIFPDWIINVHNSFSHSEMCSLNYLLKS